MFYSYYGGLTCACWSPDGKYVLTGGQDDLISIWSVVESALVARCQGHQSWVSAVAFDPWRCDDRNYRFGSVGEDGRLCLWDFSVGMLHRPKAVCDNINNDNGGGLAGSRTNRWTEADEGRTCSNLFDIGGPSRHDIRPCSGRRRRLHPTRGCDPTRTWMQRTKRL